MMYYQECPHCGSDDTEAIGELDWMCFECGENFEIEY